MADDLVEISVSALGEWGYPEGELKVLVCPEHKDKTESHYEFIRRYGVRVSLFSVFLGGIAAALFCMGLFRSVESDAEAVMTLWGQFLMFFVAALYPHSAWALDSGELVHRDAFSSLRGRILWSRIFAGFMGLILLLRLVRS